MLNREKFAKEIMDIAMKHSIVAVTEEGRPVKCGKDIGCDRCILSVFHNAEAKCDVAFGIGSILNIRILELTGTGCR